MLPRQRDILPLPTFDAIQFDRLSISRSSARRLHRKNKNIQWANSGIAALNALGGDGKSAPDSSSCLNSGSIAALRHIEESYSNMGDPHDSTLTPEGAFRELLGGSSFYTEERADILPYAKELVSWPDIGTSPCRLEAGLCPADRVRLADWKSSSLRSDDDYRELIRKSYLHFAFSSAPED